jgi:cell division protein FtsI (penicillin-binding protein 3)
VASRGTITDSEGEVLATSVDRYDIVVNQHLVKTWSTTEDGTTYSGAAGAAQLMAPILGVNAAELGAKLDGDSGYRYVAKNVLPEVWQAVRELRINGITSEQVAERIYPNANLAGNLLGWVNAEGQGAQGLEATLDDQLSGTPGKTVYERGAGGQPIPGGFEESTPATDGRSVQLTINADIQWKAQQAIEQQVAATGADSGTIVMTSVKTGEVLAMAESRTVDPNDPGADDSLWGGSSAVSDVFEPGSTAKIITMAAAIEEGTVTPESEYEVPYEKYFEGERIKDSHQHPDQRLTLAGVLKNSSNVGTVQISETLTPEVRHDYLLAFGLGQKTGVELPGESAGIVHPASDWTGRTRYTTSFGQGYSVNALQMVSAVGTFANDGVRVQPSLISGVKEADGSVRPLGEPERTRVVSSKTADTMQLLMDNAVDDETSSAAVPGYAIAGKTGTAQVPDGTYTASFIGFAPADDPEIVVGVFLFGLNTFISGSRAAAPAFSELTTFALQNQGIAPTGVAPRELENEW